MGSHPGNAARPTAIFRARRLDHTLEGWLRGHLLDPASTIVVVMVAVLPVFAAIWLLLLPRTLFSRDMTWDLLFNLSGAWHVFNGDVPHIDFHDPLGRLNFQLTRLGFSIAGVSPLAFLVGEFVVLAGLFTAAVAAVSRRLPTAAAVIFVVHNALLVILPVNVGDLPNAYSFAMSYNRWGWAALTSLCLILFIEPRRPGRGWADATVAALLLAFMFYVKITFAIAGVAAIGCALVWMHHMRQHWRPWAVVLAVFAVDVVAPHNRAYLVDVWQAAGSGYVKGSLRSQIFSVLANQTEYALYGSGVLVLFLLWRSQWARFHSVLSAVAVLCLGAFVLSQNSQTHGIPLGIVIVFLLYQAVRTHQLQMRRFRTRDLAIVLATVLTGPLLAIGAELATLVGYARAASRDSAVWSIEHTNLRGLAVPLDRSEPMSTVPRTRYRLPGGLGDLEERGPSSADFVETLIEAAQWLTEHGRAPTRVMTLDWVNAMPFVLGYPPPRGGNLWLGAESPQRTFSEQFADVDVVLIPKYGIHPRSTAAAVEQLGPSLFALFPVRHDITSWTILSRSDFFER